MSVVVLVSSSCILSVYLNFPLLFLVKNMRMLAIIGNVRPVFSFLKSINEIANLYADEKGIVFYTHDDEKHVFASIFVPSSEMIEYLFEKEENRSSYSCTVNTKILNKALAKVTKKSNVAIELTSRDRINLYIGRELTCETYKRAKKFIFSLPSFVEISFPEKQEIIGSFTVRPEVFSLMIQSLKGFGEKLRIKIEKKGVRFIAEEDIPEILAEGLYTESDIISCNFKRECETTVFLDDIEKTKYLTKEGEKLTLSIANSGSLILEGKYLCYNYNIFISSLQ